MDDGDPPEEEEGTRFKDPHQMKSACDWSADQTLSSFNPFFLNAMHKNPLHPKYS